MPKYRKKPVVIEAFQFVRGYSEPTPEWFAQAITEGKAYFQGGDEPYWTIETLEGNHKASLGDFIIQGVKGEIYPCKPDIFEATYDSAE